MAWRDSRRNRSRLLLFITSSISGIAALVATFSLGFNIQKDINSQAKNLVGADLVIESNRKPNPQIQKLLDSLGDHRSQERSFASMIYFLKNNGTRLIQVRALEGEYPYYGELETNPSVAGKNFRMGRKALVDKTLMLQYNAQVGDSIKIGELIFSIAGVLNKAPGRNEISTTVAPPVYIPFRYLSQTGLIQKGSQIGYCYYYKYDSLIDIEKLVSVIGPRLKIAGLDYETVESRKINTGRVFDNFSQFLTLISFIALLLGCIGVASAIHIYIREKSESIAILRCLGVKSSQVFLIYLIQVAAIGFIGSVTGAFLGTIIQQLMPLIFKDFLPFQVTTLISWISIGQGILIGIFISVLFGLLPLISVRNISPLYSLRLSIEQTKLIRDPIKWLFYSVIFVFILSFSRWQMHNWIKAIIFSCSVLAAFLLLGLVASLLMWLARRFFPHYWNYLWRQGFANLYRPNNQTTILIITIGLGAAFIGTLYFVQSMLIGSVNFSERSNESNMVLFDIQAGQRDSIQSLIKQFRLPIIDRIPIVTMRIEEINGKNAGQVLKDSTDSIPNRAFESEIRATFRNSLNTNEKIISGEFGRAVQSPGDSILISLEERYARRLHVKIRDKILFNVQGSMIPTFIGSLRQTDMRRIQPNFRIVFPPGVLESAPQFYLITTHIGSSELSAQFQQAVIRKYPNISIIDLGLILSVLNDLLDKISFVIRFMAGFSMATGLIVLIASVLISKFQRVQESVLLRTMGASRKQILIITTVEYFFLGAIAAATGIIISIAASWALAKYSFESNFSMNWLPVVAIFLSICIITIFIGLLNSREVLTKTPLEILRNEI